ncbi:CSLREA domain-containing protein [Wenzhouxiangella marina]|nr:CSLREA domain-containing protein [Wenzhouxiangella marina]MBB6086254.1 CSLREA domain-containing protein [Wenzhouxiangella marina]
MLRHSFLTAAVAQALLLGAARAATITVDATIDAVPADDGSCTLREAIENANTDSQNGRTSPGECEAGQGADLIDFDASIFGGTQIITLSQGEMVITESITIAGTGAELLTIDANQASRHFHIDDGSSGELSQANLSDLALVNGSVTGNGGAILTRENLILERSTISGSVAEGSSVGIGRGGAIYAGGQGTPNAYLMIESSNLINNESHIFGGAVVAELGDDSSVVINDSFVENNASLQSVGGARIRSGINASILIQNSSISVNTSVFNYGGLFIQVDESSSVVLQDTVVSQNSGRRIGGAEIRLDFSPANAPGSLSIRDSFLSGNLAEFGPAGLATSALGHVDTTIERTSIRNNTATRSYGGANVSWHSGDVQIIDSTISGNVAGQNSGGLYLSSYSDQSAILGNVSLIGSRISGNSAASIGGLKVYLYGSELSAANLLISGSEISDNSAYDTAGAEVYLYGRYSSTSATISNTTISGNEADRFNGGLRVRATREPGETHVNTIELVDSTVTDNAADLATATPGAGAGIRLYDIEPGAGRLSLNRSIVAGNRLGGAGTVVDLDANGVAIEAAYSLIGDNTGSSLAEAPLGSPDANGNLIGDPNGSGVIDPRLGPLFENGGSARSHAPRASSPALDAAGTACSGPDQRGVPRPQGAACDMGSVELTDGVFSDRFEASTVITEFGRRVARLVRAGLLGLRSESSEATLLLEANEPGAPDLRHAWLHGRHRGRDPEIRLSRFEDGQLSLGAWVAVTEPHLEIRW